MALMLPQLKFVGPPCYYRLHDIKKYEVWVASNSLIFILNFVQISQLKSWKSEHVSNMMNCRIWGSHGDGYEESHGLKITLRSPLVDLRSIQRYILQDRTQHDDFTS
jgi:hypothetical protein